MFASSSHLNESCLKPCSGMVLMSYNSQDMVRERKRMNLNKYMGDYTDYKVTSQFQYSEGKAKETFILSKMDINETFKMLETSSLT